jgi:hypothetical protein
MATHKITGYIPQGYTGRPQMTAKAVKVTIESVDGDHFRGESTWLPRSIAAGLVVREERDDDGSRATAFSATVPAWWLRKIDTRAAWEVRGHRSAPMATRPA